MNPAVPQDSETRTSDSDRPLGFLHDRGVPAADPRALAALEFTAVLESVAGHASTPLGAERVKSLVPRSVPRGDAAGQAAIEAEHARAGAMRTVMGADEPWPSPAIPALSAAIARLSVPGSVWSASDLRDVITLLGTSRAQAAALAAADARGTDVGALMDLRGALVRDAPLEDRLDKIVDDAGAVRDAASPELRKLRRQLRGAEADLIKLLEKVMAKLESHHRVDDGSVTMRDGRWVIPVRREGRGAVGGIVHDTSATGATVFVEPPAAVEFGNRIRELEHQETREVERILAEATESLRPRAEALAAAFDALVELDSLAARARFAERYRCAPARFGSPRDGMVVNDGRHPLLVVQAPERVVPFTLALDPGERTLLVSGPNTGGKTVLLKAVALLSLMAQAGVPPTVAAGSVLPLYDRVFADIGDEQSIEASLSTFSGHVRNLIEIVEHATTESLVLADELGSGTDPNEGAALAAAILEALTARGTITVATTHLGALKELAHTTPGVVNASLHFDEVALAPTYRLQKGIPGRSYGLSIARRLRMPADILARAEERVPEAERDAAAMIEDLERRQRELDARERDALDREESYAARASRVTEREQRMRERERELEREAREASRRYVLDARKEIEAAIAAVRSAGAAGAEGLDLAATTARRAAEARLAADREALSALDAASAADIELPETDAGAPQVGDHVAVASFGARPARVLEVRGDALVVALGSVRTTVPLASARRVAKPRDDPGQVAVATGTHPELDAKHEVDLRGMRISEVDGALQAAVDAAILSDLPALRIIHGKGTGALRERVAELLADDKRVRGFRLGAWNEGGAGVTLAEFA